MLEICLKTTNDITLTFNKFISVIFLYVYWKILNALKLIYHYFIFIYFCSKVFNKT